MGKAHRRGGVYKDARGDGYHDAEGNPVEGPEGAEIVEAPAPVVKKVKSSGDDEKKVDAQETEIPAIKDLPDFIADKSKEEVEVLQEMDDRKGAIPVYKARLEEIAAEAGSNGE